MAEVKGQVGNACDGLAVVLDENVSHREQGGKGCQSRSGEGAGATNLIEYAVPSWLRIETSRR